MTSTLPAAHRVYTALLVCDLVEEGEQVQALARCLDLPHSAPDPTRLLTRNMLSTLVHLATVSASAAAVVDLPDPITVPRLQALARIESALCSLLSASGSMATVLDQLCLPGSGITDAAGLVQVGRLRASALVTIAAAHLGAAAALLRADAEPLTEPAPAPAPAVPAAEPVAPARRIGRPPGATMEQLLEVSRPAVAAHGRPSRPVVLRAVREAGLQLGSTRLTLLMQELRKEYAG